MSEARLSVDERFEWPDLLLEIDTVTRVGGQLHLRFHGVVGGRERRDFGESELSNPAARLSRLSDTLDSWAAGYSEEQKSIEAHLDGIGVELYNDLIPSALREHYWSYLHAEAGSTVLILVEGEAANLPWEIVKPVTESTVAPFWCEQLSMSRWLGSKPIAMALPGHRAACVLADPELHDVSDRARSRLGVSASEVVTEWDGVQELLSNGEPGLFHWTGHGQLNPEHPSLSELPIGTEIFRPVDILVPTKRRFLRSGPWVFLHACSTNRSTVGSVGLAGWPKDLVQGGAGAMLGAAWDVRTSTAVPFVGGLYESVMKGVPVAEAVREARNSAKISGDPSWLAYQLYAHPTSRVLRDRTKADFTSIPVQKLVERTFSVPGDEAGNWRRSYLEFIAREPLQPHADVIPLGGSVEPNEDLEYSMLYVEPVVPDSVVGHEVRDIAEAASEHDGVVLLGDSGAGKSATLRRISRDLATRALRGDPDVPTPILISLHEFATGDDPLGYVQRRCRDDVVRSRLRQELRAGRVCLMCDGLNEMGRHDYRKKVRAWRQFMQDWRGNRFVFACRTSAYQSELGLPEIEIAPLDDERILRTLFLTVGASADELWQALQQDGLLDVARMPLFLEWLIVSFKRSGSRLPGNRSRLLEGIVNSFVRREEDTGSFEKADFDRIRVALAELAHAILLDSRNGAVSKGRALGIFENSHPGIKRPVVDAGWRFVIDSGFLTEQNQEVRFRDAQLRDYFAACALHGRKEGGASMRSYFAPSPPDNDTESFSPRGRGHAGVLAENEWAEAVVLASGLADSADPLLEELRAMNPRLAGECLARNSPNVTPETVEAIRETLLDRATNAHVALGERVATGLTLGRIGDPRLALRAEGFVLPELCSIPTGFVWLGSDDAQAFADERPQHRVEVPAFRIGRYPVTNAEYNCFVDAGGYDEAGYWTERGWAWRKARDTGESSLNRRLRNLAYFRGHVDDMERWFEEGELEATECELWRRLVGMDDHEARLHLRALGLERVRSRDAPAFARYPALTGANQPVVGVSWHEAVAYCAWLSTVSRRTFRLPSEAQWERAAKGDDKRVYPWGPIWEAGRCNARPENIRRTTPVGMFPGGRSPFGCEDMAGNVAEWTSSLYSPYPWTGNDGQVDAEAEGVRVNRGGGWDSMHRVVRCALRGDMNESHTDSATLGFRIASNADSDGLPVHSTVS
ncbi:SUMF1/EgtB/PvdO family nonheme iron enzyme [Streptomyces sp. NPDC001315]|uniref:SUMF1/EgtB/PvdO family nonheme iron enzyme n=1 Tax=Streptomyces sp. NPDC001315 TaxID=3364562 RepID=UPI003694E2D8